MDKPNILFVISDQHNAKILGCAGHAEARTPNIDKLAQEGVRFANAVTQNPICTPSRVSFLSGQYPHNHGYFGLGGPNPAGLPSLLGHFRNSGYATAAIGKVHCPEYWIEDDSDLFLETYDDCSIEGGKEYGNYLKAKGIDGLREDEYYPEQPEKTSQSCDGRPSNLDYEDSVEGWIVRQTIRFMEQAKAENRPFIAHASLPRPHQVYSPSRRFWDLYDQKSLSLPPNFTYDNSLKAPHLRKAVERWKRGDWTLFEPRTYGAGALRKLHGYLGCVSQVDYAVGELTEWLQANECGENTIVVYASDHGDYACEHGIMEKAPGICSDAITRIPFVWKWPQGIRAGHVVEETVEAIDLSSTLCELAGIDRMETSDGVNLAGLLHGKAGAVHRIGVTEFAWSKSVRSGRYRLVYYPREMFPDDYPDGFGELYDLESDPWEMANLYFEKQYSSMVEELRNELLNWLVVTSRPKTVLGLPTRTGRHVRTRFQNTVSLDGKANPERLFRIAGTNYL